MIVFHGRETERKYVLEAEGVMGDGWDFCSSKKEDILMNHTG
jgi:hypothetical protein